MYINNNIKLNIIAAILRRCLNGKTKALPSIFPANFPYAMIDPVNVIAPINTPRNTSTSCIAISAPTNP